VDSVNVSDIEISEEEEETVQNSEENNNVIETPASEDKEGGRFRHGRRRRRGRNREGYSSRENKDETIKINETGESDQGDAPLMQSESANKDHPAARHERHSRSQRTPRRKLRTPAHEEGADTSSERSRSEIADKPDFKEKAILPSKAEDDDAPRPLPRVPDLPELEEADQPKPKGGGKAGWWSKKLIGG
jgi:hypothetical protein